MHTFHSMESWSVTIYLEIGYLSLSRNIYRFSFFQLNTFRDLLKNTNNFRY